MGETNNSNIQNRRETNKKWSIYVVRSIKIDTNSKSIDRDE